MAIVLAFNMKLTWLKGLSHLCQIMKSNIGINKKKVVYLITLVSILLGISGIVLYNSERTDAYFMLAQAFAAFFVLSIIMVAGAKNNG